MADIQKPDMAKTWANAGDKTPPADSLINTGWNSGDIPANTDFNFIDARQDQGVAYMLQKGIPEWDSATEYQANKSWVQYGGKIYKAIQTGVNKQPNTQTAYWQDATFSNVTAPDVDPSRKLRVVAGVLRNTGTGWDWINNSGHTPVGFGAVSVVGNAIRVNYTFTANKVVSLVVCPDETFALQGLSCGASVGTTYSDIFLAAPLKFTVDCATNAVISPDIFSGLVTSSNASGVTTISHPSCTANYAPSSSQLRKTNGDMGLYPTFGYASNATYIEHNTGLSGLYQYSSGWALFTDIDTTRHPFTATWNAVAGALDITHPACGNNYDIQLTSRGTLIPVISSTAGTFDKTKFRVEFYDYAGVKVTAQSSAMNFSFARQAVCRSLTVSNGLYSIDRGYATLDPSQLVSSTGNLWVYGIMEV